MYYLYSYYLCNKLYNLCSLIFFKITKFAKKYNKIICVNNVQKALNSISEYISNSQKKVCKHSAIECLSKLTVNLE